MSGIPESAVTQLREAVEHPEFGEADDRYEIYEMIGRGGMGVVWRAHDRVLLRDVALKVINTVGHELQLSDRLAREAQVLARLEHPGIVSVYDAGVLADGRAWYVMRLIRGSRLSDHVQTNVSRGHLLRVFLRICDAVAFGHTHGVVHRDLKPENVMIGLQGDVLVLDWGVALLQAEGDGSAAAAPDSAGKVVGTPGFMAPEQATGQIGLTGERTDVFGLGAILREMVTRTDEQAPRALQSIIARATAPEIRDRYASANDLANDVRAWMDGESVSAHSESAPETVARLFVRYKPAVLLLLGYAVVRLVIFLWRGI